MQKILASWLAKGLIDKNQYDILLNDYKSEKDKSKKLKIQITLYIIGALLLGIGVIIFIQANDWLIEFFSKHNIFKVMICFILSTLSLYFGSKLSAESSKYPKLGVSLIFLSTLLIGGSYALLGQIYNIEANSFWLFLIWLLSVYPLAFIFKSQAINILSIVLFILCGIFGAEKLNVENAVPLFIIALGSFLYTLANIPIIKEKFNNFSISYKTTGLFCIFVPLFIMTFVDSTNYQAESFEFITFFIVTFLLNIANYIVSKEKTSLLKIETSYILFLVLWSIALVCLNSVNNYFVGFIANVLILVIIYQCYKFGYLFENTKFSNLATKFLNIYLIINYFRIGGKYLDYATLLIVVGIILICFGIYNEKTKKIPKKGEN